MNETSVILSCNNVSKIFHDGTLHVEVLRDISFSVHRGERVAIVGASGAGKSTFLHLLGGLDKPTTGVVRIAYQDSSQLSESKLSYIRNRYLGFIYQFHHLLPEFSVLENVCIPLLLRGNHPKEAEKQALILLKKVGLENRQHHKLGEISGGERQRTAIARALVTKPACVLADEPTGNLDQQTAACVYETLLALNSELNASLVIVTHDMNLAKQLDKIFVMENGYLRLIPCA